MNDSLCEMYSDALKMDGFDNCIAGIVERFGQPPIVCYDKEKVLNTLVIEHQFSPQEAMEYFEHNQLGSWMGEQTPCFIIFT
jgi:hypothetical protein